MREKLIQMAKLTTQVPKIFPDIFATQKRFFETAMPRFFLLPPHFANERKFIGNSQSRVFRNALLNA